jgi:hypothetical protein
MAGSGEKPDPVIVKTFAEFDCAKTALESAWLTNAEWVWSNVSGKADVRSSDAPDARRRARP